MYTLFEIDYYGKSHSVGESDNLAEAKKQANKASKSQIMENGKDRADYMGDCTRELLQEIARTQEDIKGFSRRVDGLSDDLILWNAEQLVEDIKNMIEQKKIVEENIKGV
jgi:hypothetical protein